jgi:hypothetical protein
MLMFCTIWSTKNWGESVGAGAGGEARTRDSDTQYRKGSIAQMAKRVNDPSRIDSCTNISAARQTGTSISQHAHSLTPLKHCTPDQHGKTTRKERDGRVELDGTGIAGAPALLCLLAFKVDAVVDRLVGGASAEPSPPRELLLDEGMVVRGCGLAGEVGGLGRGDILVVEGVAGDAGSDGGGSGSCDGGEGAGAPEEFVEAVLKFSAGGDEGVGPDDEDLLVPLMSVKI